MQMNQKVVIGVAGMPGAGKATLRSAAESMGLPVVIMGDEIRDETKRRGLEPTPENIGKVMLMLREEEGSTAVAKRCIPKIEASKSNIVFVDGVRSLHEVEEFKKRFTNVSLVAVHSSPEARFQRLSKRKRSDDPKGWDVFCERDLRELSVGQGDVIALADYMIVNEGSYDDFKAGTSEMLQAVIEKWKKK
jgi:dephospho-CoA kinase